jgi:hypothetical protein
MIDPKFMVKVEGNYLLKVDKREESEPGQPMAVDNATRS